MVEETRESRRVGSRLSGRSAVHAAVSRLRADLTKPRRCGVARDRFAVFVSDAS